jgi:hypothetical protein
MQSGDTMCARRLVCRQSERMLFEEFGIADNPVSKELLRQLDCLDEIVLHRPLIRLLCTSGRWLLCRGNGGTERGLT